MGAPFFESSTVAVHQRYGRGGTDRLPIVSSVMADERALEALLAGSAEWSRFLAAVPGRDIDLAGADLTAANLSDADLINADLTRADLTDADLINANLTRADLTDANLINARLTRADLTAASLFGADLTRANLTRASLFGADLTGADLTDANLTAADLTAANLIAANLTRANLTHTDFTAANLTRANLTRTHITGAILDRAVADGAVADGAWMSSDTRNTQGLDVGGFLIGEWPLGTSGADVPDFGTVRIGIPELRGGMPAGELARLSDAITVIAELSQRVGVELKQWMLSEDDRGGGTSVLTATAGDEFGPIVVRRI